KRILADLVTNAGIRAMPGHHHGILVQGVQPLPDRTLDLRIITAPQVGTAYAPAEQGVAGNEQPGFGEPEAHPTGGMPRGRHGHPHPQASSSSSCSHWSGAGTGLYGTPNIRHCISRLSQRNWSSLCRCRVAPVAFFISPDARKWSRWAWVWMMLTNFSPSWLIRSRIS